MRVRTATRCGLVAALTLLAARASAEVPPAEDGEKSAQSLSEINKQLTNPVSSIWSITFQQNNLRLDPGDGRPQRWSSNLLFQPEIGRAHV